MGGGSGRRADQQLLIVSAPPHPPVSHLRKSSEALLSPSRADSHRTRCSFCVINVGHIPCFYPKMETKKSSWQFYNAPANGLLVMVGTFYIGARHFWEVVMDKYSADFPNFLLRGPHHGIFALFVTFTVTSFISWQKVETSGNSSVERGLVLCCCLNHGVCPMM